MPTYKRFKRSLKRTRGINVDNDPTYDYRGYYNENPREAMQLANGNPNVHFTDRYKTPLHPTFSDESIYSNSSTPGGHWDNGVFYHSPFTAKHLDETDDYLGRNIDEGGDPEISYWNGFYRLPTVTVYGKRKRKR